MDPATTYGLFTGAGLALSTAIGVLWKAWLEAHKAQVQQLTQERDAARALATAASAQLIDGHEKFRSEYIAILRESLSHVTANARASEAIREVMVENARTSEAILDAIQRLNGGHP